MNAPETRSFFRRPKHLGRAVSAAVLLLFGAILGWIQWRAGAPGAAFGGFPDEPAHYIGGVLMKEYIANGLFCDPVRYAVEYYSHTPYFAVGVWPPMYYLIEGIWMSVFGVGREAVLWLNVISGTALAFLIFSIVRVHHGAVAGTAAGVMVLAVPAAQWSACVVMVDLACTALAIASLVFLARYFDHPGWRNSLLFGMLAAVTVLTKNSAYYVLFVPAFLILLRRQWRLLAQKSFWIAPIVFALLYGPWLILSRRVLLLGIVGLPNFTPADVAAGFVARLWNQNGILMLLALPAVAAAFARPRRTPTLELCLYSILFALPFSIFLARVPVQDRLLIAAGGALAVASVASVRMILSRLRLPPRLFPLAVVLLAGGLFWKNALRFPHPPQNELRAIVATILKRDGPAPGSVLVPSRSEGQWIAEFVQLAGGGGRRTLIRPTKFLASESWNATHYEIRYSSLEEIRSALSEVPFRYCIIDNYAQEYPHDRLLKALLQSDSGQWRPVLSAGRFTVYENAAWSPKSEEQVSAAMRRAALGLVR